MDTQPNPVPKATADDIFAAVNALVGAIEALENWAAEVAHELERQEAEDPFADAPTEH